MSSILLNDILFKIVFGKQQNETTLRGLLNSILGLEGNDRIVELVILNPNLEKDQIDDKGPILDIKSTDGSGRRINVEIQVAREQYYVQRSIYYLTRLSYEQLNKGDKYQDLAQCVSISILDFVLFKEQTEPHSRFRLYDAVQQRELTDLLEIHYLELPKFTQEKPLATMTSLEKWVYFLCNGQQYQHSDSIPQELINEEGIAMAIDSMKAALADEETSARIFAKRAAELEINSRLYTAKETGKAEGKAEGKKEVAKSMLALGLSDETILQATGFTAAQLDSND